MTQPLGILDGDELERAKAVSALCAGLINLVDLDAFIRTADLLASPQAALAGHAPERIETASHWAELGRALLAVRATAASQESARDAEVLAAREQRLQLLLEGEGEDEAELVAEGAACPYCGERNIDRLLIQDEGIVDCATCRRRYKLT